MVGLGWLCGTGGWRRGRTEGGSVGCEAFVRLYGVFVTDKEWTGLSGEWSWVVLKRDAGQANASGASRIVGELTSGFSWLRRRAHVEKHLRILVLAGRLVLLLDC